MSKIRILLDFVDVDTLTGDFIHEAAGTRSIDPGTIIEDAQIAGDGTAWYKHPETNEEYASPYGLYEVVEEAVSQ